MVVEKGVYKVSARGSDYQFGVKEEDVLTTPEKILAQFRCVCVPCVEVSWVLRGCVLWMLLTCVYHKRLIYKDEVFR